MVNADKGIFHCFGCHAGGDAFKFVMMMDSLNWPESVRKLGARAGIEVIETKEDIAKRSVKQEIYDVLEQAANFYHRVLKESAEGGQARKYFQKRGVSEESINKFKLGFAPYGQLLAKATKKGFTQEQLIAAGLVTKTERGNIFEYMSERIVFPIFDTQGRVVAFGGRALKDEQPKYLNSPESTVYSKSFQLYGLFQAMPALRKRKDVMVLEGYMDVVVSHQFGVENTVASSGTSLTQQQAHILKRYSDEVVLLFDSDSAGYNAARRAIDTLLETELAITVSAMPEGVDPDEYLLEHGRENFLQLIKESSVSAEEFLASQALKAYGAKTPEAKAKAVSNLIPFLEKIRNAVLRSEWIKYLSGRLGVAEDAFLLEWNRNKQSQPPKYISKTQKPAKQDTVRSAEEEIIQLIAAYPELASKLSADVFRSERNGKIFAWLAGGASAGKIVESLSDDDANWLTELLLEEKTYSSPEHTLANIVKGIKRAELEIHRKRLESEVNNMLSGEIPMDDLKRQKWNNLNKQLKGSGS
jgi:DNA primase